MTGLKALMTAEHWLSTTPQDHDMDGFFAAALKKKDSGN
jgi:16S rRNA C967 or C1407 C5-methylase (RsmB/RsmF family)